MLSLKTYEFKSDFAKEFLAKGRAELISKQLTQRFGQLSDDAQEQLSKASIAELDQIGKRLLTSATLQEALAGN